MHHGLPSFYNIIGNNFPFPPSLPLSLPPSFPSFLPSILPSLSACLMHSTQRKLAVLLTLCVIFPITIAWRWLWFVLTQTLQSLASTLHRFLSIEQHTFVWLISLSSSSFSQEDSTMPMGCLPLVKFRYYQLRSVEMCAHLCRSFLEWCGTSKLTLILWYITDS